MEKKDIELIERYRSTDHEIDKLYKEHCEFEEMLEKFNEKSYLTPNDELERKTIQKKKLIGKDKLVELLAKYKN